MDGSLAQQATLNCPGCGQEFGIDTWQILGSLCAVAFVAFLLWVFFRPWLTQMMHRGLDIPPEFRNDWKEVIKGERHYLRTGNCAALDRATAAWERIRRHPAFSESPEPFQLVVLNDGGGVFLRRYWVAGQERDLEVALYCWEEAVARAAEGSPDLAMYLTNLGNGLSDRYVLMGELGDLARAVEAYEGAVARTAEGAPELAGYLNNLGNGLLDRFLQTGELGDLTRAIEAYEGAVARTAEGSPELARRLNNLGLGRSTQYAWTGEPEDLARAIEAYEGAVARTAEGSPELASILTNLGTGLSDRYVQTGKLEDLARAIEAYEDAVARTADGSPDLAGRLNNLGTGLSDRYERTGELGDLARAIEAYEGAVARTAEGAPALVSMLTNLGTGLSDRYEQTGDLGDLARAIEAYEDAVTRSAEGAPELPGRFNNLGNGLSGRYERTGELGDLTRAIEAYEGAVARTAEGAPNLAMYLANLGNGLIDRYKRTGELGDLTRAVEAYEGAVARTAEGSPGLAGRLTNLGNGLSDRYGRTGELGDLTRAIEAYEGAVARTAEGSPGLAGRLTNLGTGLSDRYGRTGELGDLARAIEAYEGAVARTADGSPDLAGRLNNLGTGLSDRYGRTGELGDLARAIEAYEGAVTRSAEGAPNLAMYLTNLGTGLSDRYERTGELGDLARAIEAYEGAVARTADGSPDLAGRLNNLGNGLSDRYGRTGELGDLARAIEAYEGAVARTADGSPDLAGRLNNLGTGLSDRYGRTGELGDLARAIEAYRNGCRLGLESAREEALRAARNWGRWAAGRAIWDEAAEAYNYGMGAAEALFQAQVLRAERRTWLVAVRGLHAAAGYARAQIGELRGAAAALELGRARLLGLSLARRLLEQLERERPALAEAYRAAAGQVEGLESGALEPPPGASRHAALRGANQALQAAIEGIRGVEGYADFLVPPDWDDVARAVRPGRPLAFVAATEWGGLALLVHAERGTAAAERVWLDLSEADLREMMTGPDEKGGWLGGYQGWQRAYLAFQNAVRQDCSRSPLVVAWPALQRAEQEWHATMERTLVALWPAVMEPLLGALEGLGAREATLVPLGLLALLPLHAAWHLDGEGKREYALDRVAFAYAPSAGALAHARAAADAVSGERLFAVDNPTGDLRYSAQEVAAAAAHFERCFVVAGDRATRNTALPALPSYDVWHFACHGVNNWSEPERSALFMHGGVPLAVADLRGLDGARARLAFLSACETGLIGTTLPDEVEGLAAGFLQVGAAGVVATLWSVADQSTAKMAERFYQNWKSDTMEPLQALVTAQQWLRRADGGRWSHPYYWAAFALHGS